ncbi:MAG TPA: phosphoribosylamine--glycine ligase [Gemmatimonadaceae bacterium]|nr:phosphoribosylamine--glycine ligase [Gemmatimonadaceae bacterium]
MKVLIVGGGGREHALAWKLKRDDPTLELLAAPGNPGIAELARCVAVGATDVARIVELATSERVDLVVVGPEAPLAAGLCNALRARGVAVFGPSAAAARLETSKRFAKDVMVGAGVPTAHASHHTDVESARRAVAELGAPVVIKATGLAAGKGVIVCETIEQSHTAIDQMLRDHSLGDAGNEILVEEFMEGEELSLFALTDGERFLTMLPVQDHKRLFAGDAGPNTGGMGAYAPVAIGTPSLVRHASERVIAPTLAAMRDRGAPFAGLLYTGLMITADGPKVVEFNCRFGDPETQAILPLMQSSLLDAFMAVAAGGSLSGVPPFEWESGFSVTTVLAARGYPDSPASGDAIVLPAAPDGVIAFHAGTRRTADGALVTAGGRVLAVTAVARAFDAAQRLSADYASAVDFAGKQYRGDIGWRESARRARAT